VKIFTGLGIAISGGYRMRCPTLRILGIFVVVAASSPMAAAQIERRDVEFRDGAALLKGTLFAADAGDALGVPRMVTAHYRVGAVGTRNGLSLEQIQKAIVLEKLLWELMSGADVVE
jgi:hypothetical protein